MKPMSDNADNASKEAVIMNHLYYFNSHTRSDDEVIRTFIARKDVFDGILKRIKEEKNNSIPQHYIIIGARGMGKTTLLKRLEIELRKETPSKKFIPILFPEEQYNIDRLSKFWLNSLDALADTLEQDDKKEEADALDAAIRKLNQISEDDKLTDEAFRTLMEISLLHNRRPVFLIDNIDILFDSISETQQFKLRKLITGNGAPIFIGASAENPKESGNYDAAFYDAFDNIYLPNLDRLQMRDMLIELAKQTHQEDFINSIYAETAQLDALHSLSGGNPRVAVFMFQLIVNGLSERIFENLNTLLDLITPLYKSTFEQLPKQAQVIVDALALNWDPCDIEQLSQLTKLANNQLSSQLDRLIKLGWVERDGRFSEEKNMLLVKNKNYSVRERFFNVWYIMRRASRRQRGDLKSLTCFLETFYTPQHLLAEKERMINLIRENLNAEQITYALALSKAYQEQSVRNEMEEEIYRTIVMKTEGDQQKMSSFINPDHIPGEVYYDYVSSSITKTIALLEKLTEKNDWIEARSLLETYITRNPDSGYMRTRLGAVLEQTGDKQAAVRTYLDAIRVQPDEDFSYIKLADLLDNENDAASAEKYYIEGLERGGRGNYAMHRFAEFLISRHRYDEAEFLFKELLAGHPNYVYPWSSYGDMLIELGRTTEAEAILSKGLEIHPQDVYCLFSLGKLKYDQRNMNEAIIFFRMAVQIEPDKLYLKSLLCRALEGAGESEKAKMIYKEVLNLDPNETWALSGYARLCFNTKDYSGALRGFRRMAKAEPSSAENWVNIGKTYHYGLSNPLEAKKAYQKALKLDKNHFGALVHLGQLRHFALGEYAEALENYNSALKLRGEPIDVMLKKAELLSNYFFDYEEARVIYENILTRDKNSTDAILGLSDLLRDKLGDWAAAEALMESLMATGFAETGEGLLQSAVISAFKENWGLAVTALLKVLVNPDPANYENFRLNVRLLNSLAVIQKLGFGEKLAALYEENDVDGFYRPYFEAVKALNHGSKQYFLNIAPEIRNAAETFYERMLNYQRVAK